VNEWNTGIKMIIGAERHHKKMLEPLPAGLGPQNKTTGPNLFLPVMYYLSKRPGNDVKRNSITTGRNVGDVEIIGISMKRKSLETRRSPLNIKQIQLKVKRIKIEVKRIEIAVERKISAVERKNSAVERKISAVQRKISYVKSLRIYLNEI